MSNNDELLAPPEQTTLRAAVQALQAERNRYQALYDFAPIGYLTLNNDNIIDSVNLTGAALFNMAPEQLINRPFSDFVSPEDNSRWQGNFDYARQSGGKQQCELTFLRQDGTVFYAYLEYIYVALPDTAAMLHIMFSDITQQVLLRDCDEVYYSILAATLDGFWVFNPQGKLLDVNNRYATQSGYARKELLTMTITDLEIADSADTIMRHLPRIMETGGDQFESLHRRKDGSSWHVEISLTYLDYYGGRFYAFLRDITKRKQDEEETKEINAALSVLLRQRETDKSNAQEALSLQVEATVLPFLERLKKYNADKNQSQLFEMLETNLQQLVKAYGRANTLSSIYKQLTPVEIQVASMIRQGLSSKLIAATLHISEGTVSIHRKHIRKKLGLSGKTANLSSYLASLAE